MKQPMVMLTAVLGLAMAPTACHVAASQEYALTRNQMMTGYAS